MFPLCFFLFVWLCKLFTHFESFFGTIRLIFNQTLQKECEGVGIQVSLNLRPSPFSWRDRSQIMITCYWSEIVSTCWHFLKQKKFITSGLILTKIPTKKFLEYYGFFCSKLLIVLHCCLMEQFVSLIFCSFWQDIVSFLKHNM